MKIYARQINPEYQESPIFMGDEFFPDNIAVCGNCDYHSHKPEFFENVQNVLEQGELAEILEYPKEWAGWYKNATQAITEYLPPENGKRYSTNAIHALRELTVNFSRCRSCEENEIFCKVLSIVTGKKWEYQTINGYCQGEWNILYYPVDEWSAEQIKRFECEYFDTGSEWIIHDGENTPETPEQIEGYCIYCVGNTDEQIKQEIAAYYTGDTPEDVILYAFNDMEI